MRRNLTLVIADVLGVYPNIPHESGLNAVEDALDNKERKSIRIITLNLMKKLNNDYQVQLLGLNKHKPMVLFCYADDIFFILIHDEKGVQQFPEAEELDKTYPNLEFIYDSSKEKILSLNLFVSLFYGNLHTDLHIKTTDCQMLISNTHHLIQIMRRNP